MLDQREQVVEESGLTRRCCERTLWQRGPNCDRVRPRNAQGCRAGGDEKGIRGRASARAPGRPTPREAWWLWGLFPPLARDEDGGPSGSTRLDPAAAIRCTPISDSTKEQGVGLWRPLGRVAPLRWGRLLEPHDGSNERD